MRRMICFWLACLLLITCVGCGGGATVSSPISDGISSNISSEALQIFAVAYSKEDTLNPYAAATEVNLALAGLLYDSLTVLDSRFMPQLSLAKSVTRRDATHLAVQLRPDGVFSDGTAVKAADVMTSFRQAKASANYTALLSNVTDVSSDRRTGELVFTLASADPHAEACLTFPIIKADTLTAAVDEAPIGGGLYVLQQTDTGSVLQANARLQQPLQYPTVYLRHLPNSDAMYYGLTSGNITYYYSDLNVDEPPRVSGTSAAVNMNALVYLGCNSASVALSDAAVRRALSQLIDRKTLASSGFAGWAKAATTPFHPDWGEAEALAGVSDTRDLPGALHLLETVGYGTAAGQTSLQLELIYSQEGGFRSTVADMVRSQLEGAGVAVTVTPLDYAEYMARLSAGKYDLYIGEVRLPANMSLQALMPGGNVAYGVSYDSPAAIAYRQYLTGELTIQDFSYAFVEDMPYIPLCWRSGFAAYDRRLTVATPHGYNPFFGFAGWK